MESGEYVRRASHVQLAATSYFYTYLGSTRTWGVLALLLVCCPAWVYLSLLRPLSGNAWSACPSRTEMRLRPRRVVLGA